MELGGGAQCALEALAFSANGAASALIACGGHERTVRVLELRFDRSSSSRAADGSGAAGDLSARSSQGRGKDSCARPYDAAESQAAKLPGALIPRCCCRGHHHTIRHLDFSGAST